jgi:predicted metal-dependent hydrolase
MKRGLAAALLAQLSLFDEAPLTVPPPASARGAAPPDAAPRPAAAPVGFRHPQTAREVRLGEHVVGYALRRGRRRSIGFVVAPEGLSVAAPRWVAQADIEAALQEKAAWILRKLAEQRERARRREASRIDWRDGAALPFLGQTVVVVLDPGVAGAVLDAGATALPGIAALTLRVGLPQTAEPAQIRDAVQGWLQRQARRVFEERCTHYAGRLGVTVRRIALSSAQTRWGSANADGAVRLNWRLVHFALPTIDYVVAHELAHLRVMNHSPKFWDVVRSVMPDYEQARDSLSDDALPLLD